MAWTVPDKGEGASNIQSILFQEYLDALVAGIDGVDCVLSGGAVTTSSLLTVAIAKAAVLTNAVLKAVAATTKTLGTADVTNPRLDLVVVDSSGAVQVRAGTAAAAPKPANRTANDVLLAVIYVPALLTVVVAGDITDLRVMRTTGPRVIDKVTTAVTHNTDAAAFTYYSLVLPSGLFLAGKILRVRCGGNYLSNSGTPTWTLTIVYGGTTMFADAYAATTADTDRGAWALDFTIIAQANNDQALVGFAAYQSEAAKTAPTTGMGDLAINSRPAAFSGSAAVDSDAADRTLTVQWTMSVSNSAVETVMEYATAELM